LLDQDNKSRKPAVSVVIPVYNEEDTIGECLGAMANQEQNRVGEDYEIIVVNDGSTDRTRSITEGFTGIRLINLPQNSGRIVARRIGVEAARSDTVLLIDSRVMAAPTLLASFFRVGYTPLMAGDLGENKYRSRYDTLFFLLRRIYYRPYYPQTSYGREFWLTPENFERGPKGTTCLFIEKDLFLSVLPEDQGKTVNDDTRLLERVVKQKGIRILRRTDLKASYQQRTGGSAYRKWLVERGVRFADYYLSRKPVYLFLLLCSYLSVALFLAALVLFPLVAAGMLILAAISYLFAVFAISEEKRDWLPVSVTLVNVAFLFWIGVSLGLLCKLGSRWKRQMQ